MLQLGDHLTRAIDELTKQVKMSGETLEKHHGPLTSPTGLALSVTALRNVRHLMSGSRWLKFEPMDPRFVHHTVLAEVLEIDRRTALKIWNHFRGHSGHARLEDLGLSAELIQKINEAFQLRGD